MVENEQVARPSSREKVIALAKSWRGPQGVLGKGPAKKAIGIEDLLAWTYCEELPKARGPAVLPTMANASAPLVRCLEELSLAVDPNRFGVIADFSAGLEPHPDAIIVHDAVMALDSYDLALPEDWSPMGDLDDLGTLGEAAIGRAIDALTMRDAAGTVRLRRRLSPLILRHAILGGEPDWSIEQPVARVVMEGGKPKWFCRSVMWMEGAFGPQQREIEVDGYDAKRKRPRPDAYQKFFLDPDPHLGILGRADYELWHAALSMLVEDLADRLEAHEAIDSPRPPQPWMGGAFLRKGRILTDLTSTPCPMPPPRQRRRRKRACVAADA
jgi:hypothetical protein